METTTSRILLELGQILRIFNYGWYNSYMEYRG